MFNFMVTSEGGLTTAGYAIAIIAGIVLFLAAIYFAGKHSEKHKLTTRQLVFCAVAMALAFVTSYLKIFTLPWGGSVTLCSMLFIVLVANRFLKKLANTSKYKKSLETLVKSMFLLCSLSLYKDSKNIKNAYWFSRKFTRNDDTIFSRQMGTCRDFFL